MKKTKRTQKINRAKRKTYKIGGVWNKCSQKELYEYPSDFLSNCCYEEGKSGWKYKVFKERESRCKSARIINRFSRDYKRSIQNLENKLTRKPQPQPRPEQTDAKGIEEPVKMIEEQQNKKELDEERRLEDEKRRQEINERIENEKKMSKQKAEEEAVAKRLEAEAMATAEQLKKKETKKLLKHYKEQEPKEGMIDYSKKMEALRFDGDDEYKVPYFYYLTDDQQMELVRLFLRAFSYLNIDDLVEIRNDIIDVVVLPVVQMQYPNLELKELSKKQYFLYFEQLVVDAINDKLEEMGENIYIGDREGGSISRKRKRQRQYHKKTNKRNRK